MANRKDSTLPKSAEPVTFDFGMLVLIPNVPGAEHYEDGEYGDYESVGTPMVGARFSYLLKKRLDSVR